MITKVELIEDWKKAYRLWSAWFGVLGTAVMGFFTFWPDGLLYLWGAMPAEVRRLIPEQYATAIAMFLFVGSTIALIIKQRRPKNDRTNQNPDAE